MKKMMLLTAALTLAIAMQAAAQEAGERNLKLMVRNSKGRVMRGDPMVVQIKGADGTRMLDAAGNVVLRVVDTDTLTLIAGNSIYEFPVDGFDSLQVVFRNKNRIEGYVPRGGGDALVNTGYGTLARRGAGASSASSVDMEQTEGYSTLKEYMLGRVSGVAFTGDELVIRGARSLSGVTPALIVVDGQPAGSFAAVNAYLHPNSVASITVLKDAGSTAIYGSRGAGGVVVITTKQGNN